MTDREREQLVAAITAYTGMSRAEVEQMLNQFADTDPGGTECDGTPSPLL